MAHTRTPVSPYPGRAGIPKEVYESVERAFLALKNGEEIAADGELRFRQGQPGYDALILAMRRNLAPRFTPLFDRRWIGFLAHLLDLPALPQIDGALHHVPINSRSGWIHNDFCSGGLTKNPQVILCFQIVEAVITSLALRKTLKGNRKSLHARRP